MTNITCADLKRTAGTVVEYLNVAVEVVGVYPLVFGQGIGAVRVLVALGLSAYDVAGLALCAGAAAVFRRYESTVGWAEKAGPRAQQHWDSLKGRDLKQISRGVQEFAALRLAVIAIEINIKPNEGAKAELRPAENFGKYFMAGIFFTPIVGTPPAAVILITNVVLLIINAARYLCSGSDLEWQGALKKRAIYNVIGMGFGAVLMIPGGFIPFALVYGCFKCCCPEKLEQAKRS